MSSNVGLSTPRGTGTSGYVQRNLSHLRPRDDHHQSPRPPPRRPGDSSYADSTSLHAQVALRQPAAEILDHARRRRIEAGVFALRCELEDNDDEEVDEEEIETRCAALRAELEAKEAREGGRGGGGGGARGLKSHQVHELAAAKIQEDERVRRALGIGVDGKAESGGKWRQRGGAARGPRGGGGGGDGWVERDGGAAGGRRGQGEAAPRRRGRSPRRSRSPARRRSPPRDDSRSPPPKTTRGGRSASPGRRRRSTRSVSSSGKSD